jgi:hypothetical protein
VTWYPPITGAERERLKRELDRATRARLRLDSRGRLIGTRSSSSLGRAEGFLLDALADGPRPRAELANAAIAAGISDDALMKAKTSLGVRHARDGGATYWRLPGCREG